MDGGAVVRGRARAAGAVRAVLVALVALAAVGCGSAGDDLGTPVAPGVYQVKVSETDLAALEKACDDELSETCGGVAYLQPEPCDPREPCVPITVDVRNGTDAVMTASPTPEDPTLCDRAPTLCAGVTLRAEALVETLADAVPDATEPTGTTPPPGSTTAPPASPPPTSDATAAP